MRKTMHARRFSNTRHARHEEVRAVAVLLNRLEPLDRRRIADHVAQVPRSVLLDPRQLVPRRRRHGSWHATRVVGRYAPRHKHVMSLSGRASYALSIQDMLDVQPSGADQAHGDAQAHADAQHHV